MLRGDRVRVIQGDNRGRTGTVGEISLGVTAGSTLFGFTVSVDSDTDTFTDVPNNLKVCV